MRHAYTMIDWTLSTVDVAVRNHRVIPECDYFSDHLPVGFQAEIDCQRQQIINKPRNMWNRLKNQKVSGPFIERIQQVYDLALQEQLFEHLGSK